MGGFQFVRWHAEFATGVESIDAEHQRLVEMINELYDAMRSGRRQEIVQPLFSRLTEYVASHFANEEELMLRHQYPGLTEHRQEHQRLAAQVAELWRGGEDASLEVCMELFNFLRSWLNGHILQRDHQYIPFLSRPSN